MRKFFLITLLIVLVSASAQAVQKSTDKQQGQVRPDKALVYLIRQAHWTASARTQFVYADQTFLATLDNNTYTYTYVDPGQHLIWTNWTTVQKNLEFVAGQTYYLEIFSTVDSLIKQNAEFIMSASLMRFAKPTDKEIAKSAEQIENRYERAVKKMEKEPPVTSVASAVLPPLDLSSPALQPRKGSIQLPQGTSVTIKLMENVSSSRIQAGQEVLFEVVAPVIQNGKTLIRQGASVKGIVQSAKHGKTGGKAGTLNILVSSVTAVDGCEVPVAGQLSQKGDDRTDTASVNTVLFGLAGFLTTKSREGFLLSQTQFQVPLRSDVHIVPTAVKSNTANVTTNQLQPYPATIADPVTFKPDKKSKVANIQVELSDKFQWDKLTLVSAQGVRLPTQVATTTKTGDSKKQIFVFPGWDLMRFIPLGLNAKEYKLDFLAESGGKSFPAAGTLVAVVKK